MNLSIDTIAHEIYEHQGCAWNGGCWNNGDPIYLRQLTNLFRLINSDDFEKLTYCYSGNLFRIHPSNVCMVDDINKDTDIIIRTTKYNECVYVNKTQYLPKLMSFSKSCDFTHMHKVNPSEKAMLFHVNTIDKTNNRMFYGIDINEFLRYYNLHIDEKFIKEQEVLFLLQERFIVDERLCTPKQFKYYKRNIL